MTKKCFNPVILFFPPSNSFAYARSSARIFLHIFKIRIKPGSTELFQPTLSSMKTCYTKAALKHSCGIQAHLPNVSNRHYLCIYVSVAFRFNSSLHFYYGFKQTVTTGRAKLSTVFIAPFRKL